MKLRLLYVMMLGLSITPAVFAAEMSEQSPLGIRDSVTDKPAGSITCEVQDKILPTAQGEQSQRSDGDSGAKLGR